MAPSGRPPAAVILAAGRGRRFPGVPSKVLVRLAGRTLVEHVLDTVESLAVGRCVVVVGHGKDAVQAQLAGRAVEFADQGDPLGTGHAVLVAGAPLREHQGALLVLNGDVPLVRRGTLEALLHAVSEPGTSAAVLCATLEHPGAYGRVVRGPSGSVAGIVEAADADDATLKIQEINVGAYAFLAPEVFEVLATLAPDNAQREIYLTDVVRTLVARGRRVAGVVVQDPLEAAGVNTPDELAGLERAFQQAARPAIGTVSGAAS